MREKNRKNPEKFQKNWRKVWKLIRDSKRVPETKNQRFGSKMPLKVRQHWCG